MSTIITSEQGGTIPLTSEPIASLVKELQSLKIFNYEEPRLQDANYRLAMWDICKKTRMGMAIPMTEGVKFDGGKARMDLLPFDALESISDVLTYGAKKYAVRNWEKGMSWGRLVGATLRHLSAWCRGQEMDPESKLPHLSHFGCCALMLLALYLRKVGTDDRVAK